MKKRAALVLDSLDTGIPPLRDCWLTGVSRYPSETAGAHTLLRAAPPTCALALVYTRDWQRQVGISPPNVKRLGNVLGWANPRQTAPAFLGRRSRTQKSKAVERPAPMLLSPHRTLPPAPGNSNQTPAPPTPAAPPPPTRSTSPLLTTDGRLARVPGLDIAVQYVRVAYLVQPTRPPKEAENRLCTM